MMTGTGCPWYLRQLRAGRWAYLLFLTVCIQLFCCLLFPQLICGGCFHWEAAVLGAIPLAWSIALLVIYRSKTERVMAYLAFALAVWWLLTAHVNNGYRWAF